MDNKVIPITENIESMSLLTDWELEFQVNSLRRVCDAKGVPIVIALENGGRQVIYKSRGARNLKELLKEAAKGVK